MEPNSTGSWVSRALASGLLKWIGFQVATLAGPLLIGLLTMALGRLGDGTPWMWAVTAASLAVGGSAAGVYFTLATAARYRVRGRLAFASPRIAFDIRSGDVSLGINLQNLADVPVEFEIKQLRTQLGGSYPPSKPFARTTFEIPPGGQGWFSDFEIKVDKTQTSKPIDGTVVACISYGRPGARKHQLDVRCGVHLRFASTGSIEATAWEFMA